MIDADIDGYDKIIAIMAVMIVMMQTVICRFC